VFCLNLISSPGSGKTSLLERTLEGFAPERRSPLLTGDIQTDNGHARRLAHFGFPVRQITTAPAIWTPAWSAALEGWPVEDLEILFSKQSATLVCPTSYDLGEEAAPSC